MSLHGCAFLEVLLDYGNLSWTGFANKLKMGSGEFAEIGIPNRIYQAAMKNVDSLWKAEITAPTKTLIGFLNIAEDSNVRGTSRIFYRYVHVLSHLMFVSIADAKPATAHLVYTHSPASISPSLSLCPLFIVAALCATLIIFSALSLLRSNSASYIYDTLESALDTPNTESAMEYTPDEEDRKAIGVHLPLGTHGSIFKITDELMLTSESLNGRSDSESSSNSEALTFDEYADPASPERAREWTSVRIQYWVETDVLACLRNFEKEAKARRAKAAKAEERRLDFDAMVVGMKAYAERLGMEARVSR